MIEPESQKQKSLAVKIASTATESDKFALKSWIEEMIKLRDSDESAFVKVKKSIEITAASGALLTVIESIGRELMPAALTQLVDGLSEIKNANLPTANKLSRAAALVWTKSKQIAWVNQGVPQGSR